MNYLVHLYLSDLEPMVRLGNLMGDFVKGPLDDAPYSPDIILGLRQHRDVDSYSMISPTVKISKNRIDPAFGYFRSIMVDVFYDHFLASNWAQHAAGSLEEFAESIYRLLEKHEAILPDGLKKITPRMIKYNWLVSYREIWVMERALKRLGWRLSRKNPLAEGYGELLKNYDALEDDCAQFLNEAKKHLSTL
jgi:acyl carrier protein phosphodiesterase